jgi:hypothetical protein
MNVWLGIALTQSCRTETSDALPKALGLLLHCQIVLDRLYSGDLPSSPGRIGTGHDVLDLAGQRDHACIRLGTNTGIL